MVERIAPPRVTLEEALDRASRPRPGAPQRLIDAIRYALLAPGKRLRPRLVIAACEAVGGEPSVAMPGAVAVEMIHAYSLIHDDLPAMDDDDLRRGRPTVHRQFDEATAILAGDALQAMAFEVIASPERWVDSDGHRSDGHGSDAADPTPGEAFDLTDRLTDAQIAASIRVLAEAAGPAALVGGQADDLAAERRHDLADGSARQTGGPSSDPAALTLDHLTAIHRRKTAALLSASCRLGAIAGGADTETVAELGRFGQSLGLAFQIIDDLLDRTATAEQLGKRTGKDDGRGKLTFPALVGLEESRRLAAGVRDDALAVLARMDERADGLRHLARFVLERTH